MLGLVIYLDCLGFAIFSNCMFQMSVKKFTGSITHYLHVFSLSLYLNTNALAYISYQRQFFLVHDLLLYLM